MQKRTQSFFTWSGIARSWHGFGCMLRGIWNTPYTVNIYVQQKAEIGLIGLYKRLSEHKVGNRFLVLALGLAHKDITGHSKSHHGPPHSRWQAEVRGWARAEEEELQAKHYRGVHRRPLADLWVEVVTSFLELEQ
ncbi:hypothetical protein NDU88_002226 [Pleurodeles waltl]|uniref:Uncharacterized protein n=1 Tax=Pleurodeles waltl TaxID=8319 RepID=A0AAV7KRJ5_PLEWA|nr:hypothetical protein NDU88_002226 [Pleurodeles waltl]